MDLVKTLIIGLLASSQTTTVSPIPELYWPEPITSPEVSFHQVVERQTAVMGVASQSAAMASAPIASPTATLQPIEATPTTSLTNTVSKTIKLVLLGDSMMDTMGRDGSILKETLRATYPAVTFTIYNYGYGGTNIEDGEKRILSDSQYLGVHYPAIVSLNPDILVLESFGYNPFPEAVASGMDRQWLTITRILETIKRQLPKTKVILAATIRPNSSVFGDGAPGLSFSPSDKQSRVSVINAYVNNIVSYAHSSKLPLADAFTPSGGDTKYINAGDHIHYSDEGRKLMSNKIVEALYTYNLIE